MIRRNYKLVNLTKYGKDCKRKEVDVVGPLCTSIDKFGTIELDDPEIGDWIGVQNSGAYAYSASPKDFLSHRYPDEYIIFDNKMQGAA